MTITVQAVYENGVLRPAQPLPLAEQEKVELTIDDAAQRVRRIQAAAGIVKWSGDPDELARFAVDPAFDPQEGG